MRRKDPKRAPLSFAGCGGKKRCRMHGGAKGSGAPPGNQNALKHGFYTKQAIEERKFLRQLIRDAESLIDEIDS